MLGGCIISASFTMLADVYKKERTISQSGQSKYDWVVNTGVGAAGTIACAIVVFPATSFRAQAVNQEFGTQYKELEFFRLTSAINLGHNAKVTNIRSATTGELLFVEPELQNSPPTWFNCNGSSPVLDPFGNLLEYNTTIHRAEVQGA